MAGIPERACITDFGLAIAVEDESQTTSIAIGTYVHERPLGEKPAEARKSFPRLGPRQTGKSTLVRSLAPEIEIKLVGKETFVVCLRDPALLRQRICSARTVFIDEIHGIPSLLHTAQYLLHR